MTLEFLKYILSNQYIRSALLVFSGILIGLAFYPSNDKVVELESKLLQKQTEIANLKIVNQEKLDELESKHRQIETMSQERIRTLESENQKLIKKKRFKKVVTTLPDGTKKEEIIIITDEIEITEKLKKLEQDLFEKHQEEVFVLKSKHRQAISELNKSHRKELEKNIEEKNKQISSSKKIGLGLRYSSDNAIGGHVHYHVLGNIFMMSGLDLVDKTKLRYSIGVGLSL